MRRLLRAVGPLWASSLTLAACGSDAFVGAPDPTETVEQAIGEGVPLALVEELRIGGGDGEDALFRVRGAGLDARGRIHVLEMGNHRVSVFDASGALLHRFGRPGQGPGDLEQPVGLSVRGDTVAVSDASNRVHLFTSGGEHVWTRIHHELGAAGDGWFVERMVATPGGLVLTASAWFQRDESGSQTVLPYFPRVRAFHVGAKGDVRPAGLQWGRVAEGRWVNGFWVTAPYAHTPQWALDGLGRIHVIGTGDYVIDVYEADGRPIRRVRNQVPRVPLDDDRIDEWKASRCRAGPECVAANTDIALSLPRDEYVPVAGDVRGYVGGYTAIFRNGTDPDPTDDIMLADYDFFDPDGRYLGTLPAGASPRWFDGRTLLATVWDSLGVESLVRYRVEGSAGGG